MGGQTTEPTNTTPTGARPTNSRPMGARPIIVFFDFLVKCATLVYFDALDQWKKNISNIFSICSKAWNNATMKH